MLDFRKVLLALSVAGLGLVGTASAQIPTYGFGSSGPQNYVAAEGTTEQLPPLTISCAAPLSGTGVCTTVSGTTTFLLTSNVNFSNQLVSGSASSVDVVVSDTSSDKFTVTQPGPTTIQISAASLTSGATITVSNLRVNASTAPVSSTITIGLQATGVALVTGTAGTSQSLGFVSKALGSITVNTTATNGVSINAIQPVLGIPPNQTSCALTGAAGAKVVFPVLNGIIAEGFPDSVKVPGDTALGNVPSQGTVLAVTFTNLDAGVNYYAPSTLSAGTLQLTAYTAATGGSVATPIAAGVTGAGGILVTSASPTVYYQATATGGQNTLSIPISLYASVPSVTGVTNFLTAPVGMSIVLAGAAAPAYPGYSGGITYTGAPAANGGINGLLTPCATTLLFPYVISIAGFDTGISIANASTLPAGVAGISPSSGSCTVTFYGTGGTTPSVTYNYGTVATGTYGTPFVASAAAPGLSGYAVAVCNFVGAHGYAFVSDGFGSGGGLSGNYLAVVLSSGAAGYAPAPSATITPTF
jgi:hypothetical protein